MRYRYLQDPNNLQHKLILTGVHESNGRTLRVRCKCMAEYMNVSDRYYNYDPLGEADSIEEAVELWQRHIQESDARHRARSDGQA